MGLLSEDNGEGGSEIGLGIVNKNLEYSVPRIANKNIYLIMVFVIELQKKEMIHISPMILIFIIVLFIAVDFFFAFFKNTY